MSSYEDFFCEHLLENVSVLTKIINPVLRNAYSFHGIVQLSIICIGDFVHTQISRSENIVGAKFCYRSFATFSPNHNSKLTPFSGFPI